MSGRGRGRKRKSNDDSIGRTVRSANDSNVSDSAWDMDKPENWTVAVITGKLSELNIRPPKGFNKAKLVQLYKENTSSDSVVISDNIRTVPASVASTSSSSTDTAMKALQNHVARLEQLILRQNSVDGGQPKDTPGQHGPTVTSLPATAASDLNHIPEVNNQRSPTPLPVQYDNNYGGLLNQLGVSSESLPSVEIVPSSIRHQIKEGKDINLVLLLLPHYDNDGGRYHRVAEVGAQSYQLQTDPRLCKSLTLGEFVKAFAIYRNIMCEAYPNRRQELDTYERDIVDLALTFPGSVFYEYHKAFSARAAALLHQRNVKVNWGIRDNQLYTTLCSGFKCNSCKLCNHMSHTEEFCPLVLNGSASKQANSNSRKGDNYGKGNTDRKGRPRVMHQGREICNNFNDQGCDRDHCHFLHVMKNTETTGKQAKSAKSKESSKQ